MSDIPPTATPQPPAPVSKSSARARLLALVLLACCAALVLYMVTTRRTQQGKLRDLIAQTRSEIVKRDELIAEMSGAALAQKDKADRARRELQQQVDSLREELARSGAGVVRVAPDNRSLVSHGQDRQVRLWAIPTGQSIAVFPAIEQLVFSANGAWLALLDAKGVVSIRDTGTGKELAAIKEEPRVTRVEFLGPQRLALTQQLQDRATQLWEVTKEKDKISTRKLHTLSGDQARLSRDGGRCLTRAGVFYVWDTNTGKKLATFPSPDQKEIDLSDLAGWALSADGRFFTAETKRGQTFLGDVDTGKMSILKVQP
jgi:WD40 repeat protein